MVGRLWRGRQRAAWSEALKKQRSSTARLHSLDVISVLSVPGPPASNARSDAPTRKKNPFLSRCCCLLVWVSSPVCVVVFLLSPPFFKFTVLTASRNRAATRRCTRCPTPNYVGMAGTVHYFIEIQPPLGLMIWNQPPRELDLPPITNAFGGFVFLWLISFPFDFYHHILSSVVQSISVAQTLIEVHMGLIEILH